ncbi:MAG: LPXTG cell wall anchor domain-containing protein [Actinomycetes bacterium]
MRRTPAALAGVVVIAAAVALPLTSGSAATPASHTLNDHTLRFAPATVVDPILFGGEPGITFDPTTPDGSREFVDWPVSSRTNIGVFLRSTDGGLSFQKRYADVTDAASAGPFCVGRQVPYCPTGGGGDTDTQVDPATGTVYFSSQESLANEASGTSFDHGTTFLADHADPVTAKASGDVDRQWLGFWKGTKTVFLAYHSPIVGAYVVRSDNAGKVGSWTVPGVPQIPFVAQTGSMEVDNTGGPHNRTIYVSYIAAIPNGNSGLDESPHIAVSTDGAASFKTYKLPNLKDSQGNDDFVYNFIKLYIDTAGNLYEVQTDQTTNATYLSTSKADVGTNKTAPGSVWKGPYRISTSPANLSIFPDVRAGSPGRIAAIYYGTAAKAATPDDVKPGQGGWYPFISMSTNALCMWDANPCSSPTFHQTTVTPKMNQDSNICTAGTACAATGGNRSLADYWDIDIDRAGHVGVVWSDTTNAIGGPFVKVTRQTSGPSLYAGKANANLPNRGNGFPDPSGDAIFPIAGAQVLHSPNHPTLDLRGTTVGVNGSNIEFAIHLVSANNLGAGVPTGHDGITPLQQAKYVVRWDFGNTAYYAAANVPAGGSPSYFSGKVSKAEGILSPTNPDNLYGFGNTYSALGPATGKVVGNTLVIDVPRSAIGGANLGAQLRNVGTYAMVGPTDNTVVLETLPITVDSTPTFDTKLATAPPIGHPGLGGNCCANGSDLPTTGGSELLAGAGVLALLGAVLLRRRRRQPVRI